jgi:hypothetical protein
VDIDFVEPNGTYPYSLGFIPGWSTSAPQGSIQVKGAGTGPIFDWTRVTYGVTFTEFGLAGGTNWSVTFNGKTLTTTNRNLAFEGIPNGTYDFAVGSVPDLSVAPPNGTIHINGSQVFENITFSSSPSPTFIGLPLVEGYAVLGGIIATLAVVVAVAVLVSRRGEAPPEPGDTPARPDAGDPPAPR